MGKVLIIKNADFSSASIFKRITTYTSQSNPNTPCAVVPGSDCRGWYYANSFINQFRNKRIVSISLYALTTGTITIKKLSKTAADGVITDIKTVSISGTGYQKITFDSPIILTGTETIGFLSEESGVIAYANDDTAEAFGAINNSGWEDYSDQFALPCNIEYYNN